MEIYFTENYDLSDFKENNITIINSNKDSLVLNISGDINPLLSILAKYKISNLVFPEPTLEETFMTFYED